MRILSVRHVTTYRYKQPVAFGEHRMMLRPRDSYDQKLLEAWLGITPEPENLRWVHDVFGNCVALARFARRVRSEELRVESTIRLDHSASNALNFAMEDYARTYPFAYDAEEVPDLSRSVERQYLDPGRAVDRWARQFLNPAGPTETEPLLIAICHAIRRRFTYVGRPEAGVQDPITTLELGRGTCRDFAVLMIEAVRSLGLAARFVSGYLYVPERDRSDRVGGGSTHAWVEVYLPGAGWVEFDPTNGIVGNRDLIRVAVVRDPRQALPLSGTWYGFPGAQIDMKVEVKVTAEAEARVPVLNGQEIE